MKKITFPEFVDKFNFTPENTLKISIEREYFVADKNGNIKASGPKIAKWIGDLDQFDGDLPACQLESRLSLVTIDEVKPRLWEQECALRDFETKFSFTRIFDEVGPEDIPLDVNPKKRYIEIAEDLTEDELRPGCRVIATHGHFGMPDFETALVVYNYMIDYLEELLEMGDGSNGERRRLYESMAPNHMPPKYDNVRDFYFTAQEQGFVEDPTKCWHWIRIHPNGTIEVRVFGTTKDIDKIYGWIKRCYDLIMEAMIKNNIKPVFGPVLGLVTA